NTPISDRYQASIYCPAQVAEGKDRAVFFPEDGVRPNYDSRRQGVLAQTRRTDDLAVVVYPERDPNSVAGEREEFLGHLSWLLWPPYHRVKRVLLRLYAA
ncbi:MAG: hypothetical protein JWO19_4955, partial [Bryobacterales bacterium]|nr:hypothetical protein [Bryobacterales bacterium]